MPRPVWNVPAWQAVQLAELMAPRAAEKVPTGQELQTLADVEENVPAAQVVQALIKPTPNVPAEHATHALKPVAAKNPF